jgi:hypothetical protein
MFRGRGRGRGKGGGQGLRGGAGRTGGPNAAGPIGECVCSKCGHKEPHLAGQPCFDRKCPECGETMTRG